METRVTYRTSPETVKRLQSLADKYGMSQSALLSMLVNQLYLHELSGGSPRPADEAPRVMDEPPPPPNFPNYSASKKKRKRGR